MQSSRPFAASACDESIRAERTMSHEILLRASPVDTESAVAVQADLMAQDVASQVVALLGGTKDKVPVADRSVTWRSLPAQLLVTIHPDGRVTRRRLTGYLAADYDDFVSAVKAVLPTWRFSPALLGSCPVRQVVNLPIAFGTAGEKK
jgi:hypothetical protein